MTLNFDTKSIKFANAVRSWVPFGQPCINQQDVFQQDILVTPKGDCVMWIVQCKWQVGAEGKQTAVSMEVTGEVRL